MTTSMEQIHRIKELQSQQKGAHQIAKELGIDPKTVRKYMMQEDFSPKAPAQADRPSKLAPYKATIETWLLEDAQNRYKQRHTGKRVYDRLVQLYPNFDCSYPTVNRYVRAYRERQQMSHKGFLELAWPSEETQADFGECDLFINGIRCMSKYLAVSSR